MKPVYTLSPSKLESFRAFYCDEMFSSEDELIKTIKGESIFKTAFEYGKAYHALIENGGEMYLKDGVYMVKADDMVQAIRITKNEAEPALKFNREHPLMTAEIPAIIPVEFSDYTILLNMRMDGLEGLKLHEHKTTGRPHKRDKYEKSIQWQIYLFTAGLREAQYNVFQYNEPARGERTVTYTAYNYFRYPLMENYIREICQLFINFCDTNNLLNYVEREHFTSKYYESGAAKTGSLIY